MNESTLKQDLLNKIQKEMDIEVGHLLSSGPIAPHEQTIAEAKLVNPSPPDTLTVDMLENIKIELSKFDYGSLKEKILDKFMVRYIKEELEDVYLLLPKKMYLESDVFMKNEKWIISDEHVETPMIFIDRREINGYGGRICTKS